MNILKNKLVMGGSAAILVLALGYYFWNTAGQGPLLSGGEESGTSPLSQEILTTLSQLHTITLDPKLFSDPSFVSLTDFGVTIPPQNAGRRNPFAPVGGSEASAAIAPEAGAAQ
jgi:hypothetical protein